MKIVADLHTHSVASGHAYSTLQEMARAAWEKGLQMMALTDHGPSMPGGPHLYHFGNMRVIPPVVEGIHILRGVETNIMDYGGSLDVPENYLAKMDIILAGMHTYCYPGGSIEQNTKAMLAVMANPYVDVIVHPGNPEYPIDAAKVLEQARALGIAVEINNSSLIGSRRGSPPNCESIAKMAALEGNIIALGSDAHISYDVGRFGEALEMLLRAGVKEEQILNTSVDKVRSYLRERRAVREKTASAG